MADQHSFKIQTIPTIISALAVGLALVLGIWQVQRLTWKQGVIDEREARIHAPAAPLSQHISRPEELTFRSVLVTGTWMMDKPELLMLANDRVSKKTGYFVLTPFRRENDTYVLINRGWVPDTHKVRDQRPDDILPVETVTVEAVARHQYARNDFTPANNPVQNVWFSSDFAEMGKALDLNLEPVILELKEAPGPVKMPVPGQTRYYIPNDHLQYAITWFAMAIAGAVIWFVWHLNYNKALREGDKS